MLSADAAGHRRRHRRRRADGDHPGPAGRRRQRRAADHQLGPRSRSSRASARSPASPGTSPQHGLGALLDVRSASFDGSISATNGGAVTLDATVVFQGTPQTVHLSYDFHDLVAGAKALAKAVVPSLPI